MTYKVLSIDLDYIMGPSIETYGNILFDEDPMTRWKHLYEYTQFTETQFYIDGEIRGVVPISNRMVYFDANILHRATTFRDRHRFTVAIKYMP